MGSLTVFFGGLVYSGMSAARLQADFEECGEIEKVHMHHKDGKFQGVAWITFKTEDAVKKAMEHDGDIYRGRRLQVSMKMIKPAKEPKKPKEPSAEDGPEKEVPKVEKNFELTAYIQGLPYDVTEEKLREDFGKFGEITRLTMPKKADGRPKGTCYIQFDSMESMEKSFVLSGKEYSGRTIYVQRSSDPSKLDGGKGAGKDDKGKGKEKGKGKGKDKAKDKGKGKGLDGKDGKQGKSKGKARKEEKKRV